MSYPSPKLDRVSDNLLRIYHPEILEPITYLTASVAASGVTLTVKSNAGFSNTDPQDLLLFGALGTEDAEVKRINGAITAGTSLTVAAVTFAHAIDTAISKILYDQIEVSGSSTLSGTKTSIATININIGGKWTDYIVSGTTYAFYFVRFYNSLSTTPYYSAYSDGIAATDFDPNTVGFVRRNAFANVDEEFGGKYDMSWVLDQIYLCELDVTKELKRWSWLESFETDLGNLSLGLPSMALPSDIEDSKTNKSIMGVRIGKRPNLTYVDKTEFENIMQDVAQTTLSSSASVGATTLVLTDSRDFDDSGTVNIDGANYSYTGNTRSTNTLTGLTALSAQIDSGSYVWQNMTFGEPLRFTVYEGNIYFDVPPSSDWTGRNVWIDYYKTVSRKNSDTDTPSVNDPQLIISWIEMAVKKKKANGELQPTDIALLEYNRRKAKLIQNELSGQNMRMVPSVPQGWGRPFSWWRR